MTNVPGPQFPLYMLGARMLAMIPEVPLLQNIGVGIALMSYDGQVFWGFTADYDLVPDLDQFVDLVRESFAGLAEAAGGRGLEATGRRRAHAAGGACGRARIRGGLLGPNAASSGRAVCRHRL